MFLRDHAPEILKQLGEGLCLITTRCSCEYFAELNAFDEVLIRMRLGALAQNRVTMSFEYWRVINGDEELVARGEQQIACMFRKGSGMEAVPVPRALQEALRAYS